MQQAILYLTRFMGKTVKPIKHSNLNKNKEVQRKTAPLTKPAVRNKSHAKFVFGFKWILDKTIIFYPSTDIEYLTLQRCGYPLQGKGSNFPSNKYIPTKITPLCCYHSHGGPIRIRMKLFTLSVNTQTYSRKWAISR